MPRRRKAVVDSSDVDSDTLNSPKSSRKARDGAIEAAFAKAKSRAAVTVAPEFNSAKTSLPVRNAATGSKARAPTTRSASNSPAKSKNTSNKRILSFFNNATQRQAARSSKSPRKVASPVLDIENDLINDSSDDDRSTSTVTTTERGTKRKFGSLFEAGVNTGLSKSQKFLRPTPTPTLTATLDKRSGSNKLANQRPWNEQYGPVNLEEIAVHKRKVQDVQDWITQVSSGSSTKRLLVLRGAAGTGKTTTVKLVTQQSSLGLSEWHNPDVINSTGNKETLAAQFEEFINRTSKFGALALSESNILQAQATNKDEKQVLLVEEFPNTYSQSSGILQGFRRAILQYLAASTSQEFFRKAVNDAPVSPLVIVVSESLLTTSTAFADSFTAQRLLGSEILNHAGTTIIEFNAIAPTFMAKALDLVLVKEARRSGRRFAPGTAVLNHLSEIGDVRSAVAALEFFCLHQGGEQDWSGKIQFAKGKKRAVAGQLTNMEKESLELITQRENTLGIFHAVGKVVYNKREALASTVEAPPHPHPWLPQYRRDRVSLVDVDALLNELGTDIHIFILALHENYVLSCEGLETEDTFDSINGCMDSMSDADLLCPERFSASASRFTFGGSTTDALRQDEISFDTCVRGMLFNLPHPVKRLAPPPEYVAGRGKQARGMTGFQMLYPAALRLWRRKEQIQGLIDLFRETFRRQELGSLARNQKSSSEAGGVLSWKNQAWTENSDARNVVGTQEVEDGISNLLRGASKSELLLERIPYALKIERRKPQHMRTALSKQMSKVVTFKGLMMLLNNEDGEESEAEDEYAREEWSTDKPEESQALPKRAGPRVMIQQNKAQEDVNEHVERLVLSDDDIVDD